MLQNEKATPNVVIHLYSQNVHPSHVTPTPTEFTQTTCIIKIQYRNIQHKNYISQSYITMAMFGSVLSLLLASWRGKIYNVL